MDGERTTKQEGYESNFYGHNMPDPLAWCAEDSLGIVERAAPWVKYHGKADGRQLRGEVIQARGEELRFAENPSQG